MSVPPVLPLVAAGALALPGSAAAEPPWSAPRQVDDVQQTTALLTTQLGGRILVGMSGSRRAPTVVVRVRADGSTSHRQALPMRWARTATFRRAGVVVAGRRTAETSRGAARARVLVALGSVRGIHGIGKPRALPGTRGHETYAVGGHPAGGTVAVVTGTAYGEGRQTRSVWLYRGTRFRRVLTFRVSRYARGAAVAVGPRGEVLVVWQERHTIRARSLRPSGRAGAAQTLGRARQSGIQARIDDEGRREVAWQSQRVSEGDALEPSVVSYTSAPRGRRFAPPAVVGGSSLTGTGRYVGGPVRLVGTGPATSALAWTQYDGSFFRVQVADVASGVVGTPQTVSPAGEEAVLGDLDATPGGGQLVLWQTGTRGGDPTGPQRVAAAVRAPGATTFGPPELVSEPVPADPSKAGAATVPFPPSGAVDTRGGGYFAAWTTLEYRTRIATRPFG